MCVVFFYKDHQEKTCHYARESWSSFSLSVCPLFNSPLTSSLSVINEGANASVSNPQQKSVCTGKKVAVQGWHEEEVPQTASMDDVSYLQLHLFPSTGLRLSRLTASSSFV